MEQNSSFGCALPRQLTRSHEYGQQGFRADSFRWIFADRIVTWLTCNRNAPRSARKSVSRTRVIVGESTALLADGTEGDQGGQFFEPSDRLKMRR